MPSNYGFNGSVVSLGGVTLGKLRSVDRSQDAGGVDVTGASDTVHTSVNGIPTKECTIEILGASTPVVGSTGALVVTWNDGVVDSDGLTYRISRGQSRGSLDGEIASTITVVPTA